ncbi:UNVERIFIED_CONTAM: hypothetical protein GTU68_006546 [Idotea baltica]|nr:hypothetical protein [Idotea baltica]
MDSATLFLAYSFGIFPWYSKGQPILWWTPDPRCVLWPSELKVHKSMRSLLKKKPYTVTADHAFDQVLSACQITPRTGQEGTWITEEMRNAYLKLHIAGIAHSVEVWQDQQLIAGLYGVSIGKVFFGESMFTTVSNASKYAFILLVRKLESLDYTLIDCQQDTPHLRSLGATLAPRKDFLAHLKKNTLEVTDQGSWYLWDF